jgi:hypothetical protein
MSGASCCRARITPWAPFNGSIAISVYRAGGYEGKAEIGGSLDVYDVATDTRELISYHADGIEGPSPRSVGRWLSRQVLAAVYIWRGTSE